MRDSTIEVLATIGKTVVAMAIILYGMHSCFDSEWMKESQRKDAAVAAAEAQPRVIREVDDCKVYAFKSGEWHYFTRCGVTVTTERHCSVTKQCGKTQCTEHKQETIVTEGNK